MTPYPRQVRRDFEAGKRGNPLCAASLYETATSERGWGSHTLRGCNDLRNLRLFSRVVEVAEIWMIFLSGDETASSPVRRDLDVGERDNSSRAHAP